jgi:hypothetical protein
LARSPLARPVLRGPVLKRPVVSMQHAAREHTPTRSTRKWVVARSAGVSDLPVLTCGKRSEKVASAWSIPSTSWVLCRFGAGCV